MIIIPPYLKPGDLLRVIAPSGAWRHTEAIEAGLEIWRSHGYRVELGNNWDARYSYLAGTDHQRRQALTDAWYVNKINLDWKRIFPLFQPRF